MLKSRFWFLFCLLLCLLPGVAVSAQDSGLSSPPVVNQEYGVLATPVPEQANPPHLVFFFNYNASSFLAASVLDKLESTTSGVDFSASVVTDGSSLQDYLARIYSALVVMRREKDTRAALMRAISTGVLNPAKPSQLFTWLDQQHISRRDFIKALNSPEAIAITNALPDVQKEYAVPGTPYVVVNGKYWVRALPNMSPSRFGAIVAWVLHNATGIDIAHQD